MSRTTTRLLPPLLLLLAAALQLFIFVRKDDVDGAWFLYGRDTLFHDAVVHIHIQQWLREDPLVVPLWMPDLQGGLPTVGAFLWTPLAPNVWPLYFLDYHAAQKLGWLMALWLAGYGTFLAARAMRMPLLPSLFAGMAWMLCGHVVTLVHAGHFQKVMALGWLPWALAGAVMAADPHSFPRRTRGIGIGAIGVAMTFLSGHPQIAYIALVIACAWPAWQLVTRRAGRRMWLSIASSAAAIVALGLAGGGAQLIPGMEMSALSNRADGVSFEEAVETSYPPGEISEFIIPRVKGSSVTGDTYTGRWGERIVSDYFGRVALVFALCAVFVRRQHRGHAFFLATVVAGSLLVGLGSNTPLYGLLYGFAPGFKSFRSPGTFMAATSLGLALLAGLGFESVIRFAPRRVRVKHVIRAIAPILLAVHVLDVCVANRHFLIGWDWSRYESEFLAPTTLDLWTQGGNDGLETHDLAGELSLRPLLYGGRAINGYHPIVYKVKELRDQELGFQTAEWFHAWGLRHVLVRAAEETPPEYVVAGVFPERNRKAVTISDNWGHARDAKNGEGVSVQWYRRGPNVREAVVTLDAARDVEFCDISGPGTDLLVLGKRLRTTENPELSTEMSLGSGETILQWRYRPFAWKLGLFATALAAGVIVSLLRTGFSRPCRGGCGAASSPRASSSRGGCAA